MTMDTESFTWRIPNFSTRNTLELSSDTFLAGDYSWRIVVSPDRQVFLEFLDADIMPRGWSVLANVSLFAVKSNGLTWLPRTRLTLKFNDLNTTSCPFVYSYAWTEPYSREKIKMRKWANPDTDTVIFEAELSNVKSLLKYLQIVITVTATAAVSRNLIAEISSVTSGLKPSSGSLQLQEVEKLVNFLDMPVEAISEDDAFDDVEILVLKISEHETDPFKKVALKNMLSRVAEFKQSIHYAVTKIQTSTTAETSKTLSLNELEGRLLTKQEKISVLESNVSRLGEEEVNLESEIQVLVARKEKLADEKKSTEAELEETNQDASKELEEVKNLVEERDRYCQDKMSARERLAHYNATWKLFKEYL